MSIAEEVLASCLTFLQGEEDGLYYIEDIDESQVLLLKAYCEVNMLTDALGHHEIVTLARAIHTCRS